LGVALGAVMRWTYGVKSPVIKGHQRLPGHRGRWGTSLLQMIVIPHDHDLDRRRRRGTKVYRRFSRMAKSSALTGIMFEPPWCGVGIGANLFGLVAGGADRTSAVVQRRSAAELMISRSSHH
jgi:hypothetical protein